MHKVTIGKKGDKTVMMKTKTRKSISTIAYHTFMLIFGLIMLYPVIWMVLSSFKNSREVMALPMKLFSDRLYFENYVNGWEGIGNVSFDVFFKNSFFISGVGTIGTVIASALVAYGFARIKFPLKKFWFTCMILTMMLPYQIIMVPQFVLFDKLRWTNTSLPMIVPAFCGGAFFIFLIMQFISGIPGELDQAAKIDGCGRYGIFFRIILPLIKPAIFTAAIFSFYWKWDDFLGPLLYLNSPSKYTVSIALKMFSDPDSIPAWGDMFAMSTLSLIPIIVIFLTCQRYLVEGISTTGLKG